MVKSAAKIFWRSVLGFAVLFVLFQVVGLGYLAVKAIPFYETTLRPFYIQLTSDGIRIKRQINLRVNTHVPISTTLDTILNIPIKESVSINLPIQGNINLSIDEPFTIPVNAPIHVALDHEFRIQKELAIKSELLIDQYVKTTLLGIDTQVPIQGAVPVDLTIPFDDVIRINDDFSLTSTQPLNCQIKHDFEIPLNLTVKTQFMVDEVVPVPIKTDVKTGIRLTGDLPCFLYMNIFWDKEKGLVVDHSIKLE
ncbi:MAG: hypothetical protein JEZ12_12695 [Desulfobacterium sp.]|nr:hypothetical protein [Desulfobacterium sp.]